MDENTAIIIGAGPAGLTAAYELLKRTDIKPVILEMSQDIGGISKTVNYKGNRIDVGGHRFFSKSDRVMDWWRMMMPIQGNTGPGGEKVDITYRGQSREVDAAQEGPNPEKVDRVMLIRSRLSRIFYGRKFYNYPINLSMQTIANLGLIRMFVMGCSYLKARVAPIKDEASLEAFLINRFGRELYSTFFRDYTEKVWGVPCGEISAEWGAQRIKGLSVTSAIMHAVKSIFKRDKSIDQKDTETSLIEQFLYPKLGPGQLWEYVAEEVKSLGGEIHMGWQVDKLENTPESIKSITAVHTKTGERRQWQGDMFFSTMPVKELIAAMENGTPDNVSEVAEGLQYRDFITVGLLLTKMEVAAAQKHQESQKIVPDNWIYIQEPDVKVGRLQMFNNWSPYMVKDPNNVWIGMEYFCNEGDDIWSQPDDELAQFAIKELAQIHIILAEDVLDSTVLRMPKTYPAYFGSYERFDEVRDYCNRLTNLFLVGRNGMHKYNNADHSMLTAMVAVDNIVAGISDKSNLWQVNVEKDYHEKK